MRYPPAPVPENAGCDVEPILNARLANLTFSTQTSPIEQLEAAGISVRQHVNIDFDGDSSDEWLLWPAAYVSPIMLRAEPNGSTYIISRPALTINSYCTEVVPYTLPNGEPALVKTSYHEYEYSGCYRSTDAIWGTFQIWQLVDEELQLNHESLLLERRQLSDIFKNNGHEIHSWVSLYYGDALPAVFVWSASHYVRTTPTDAELAYPVQLPEVTPATRLAQATNSVNWAVQYGQNDIQGELEKLEAALELDLNDVPSETLLASRYVYAMALELLGRLDDAHAEYASLATDAPDSVWGMLATLLTV